MRKGQAGADPKQGAFVHVADKTRQDTCMRHTYEHRSVLCICSNTAVGMGPNASASGDQGVGAGVGGRVL